MRHAVLVLAHDNVDVLNELLRSLRHPQCDVYLHLDRKSDINAVEIQKKFSHVRVLQKRIDAAWGDFSLVEAELALIEEALEADSYEYLHLISGVDYPLHGMDHIIDFCESNRGKEFVGFARDDSNRLIRWRAGRRFLFSREFRTASLPKRILRAVHARIQDFPGFGIKMDVEVKRGAQWFSITGEFARYILSRRVWLRKQFRHTYCPDEMVVQTLCWNSRFRSCLFDVADEFHGCMRYIPWRGGVLSSLTDADFRNMHASDAFFARKFSIHDVGRYRDESD